MSSQIAKFAYQSRRSEKTAPFETNRVLSPSHSVDSLMRLRSAGILTYLEKKWIHDDFKTPSMHVQSSIFQPVEYVHIRLSIWLLGAMMLVSAFVCVLENVWYKLRFSEGSQIENRDPGSRDGRSSRAKAYRARSRTKRRGKSTLLLDTDSPVFRQSVAIRINRWRTSRLIKCT